MEEVLRRYRPEALIVGIPSDVLYTPEEIRELALGIPQAELDWIDSPHGHDAFLMEQEMLNGLVRDFRNRLEKNHESPGTFLPGDVAGPGRQERRDEPWAS